LLGTVWGVMDTFTDVAVAGSPNLTTMAPGISGALITTVTAALRRNPAMLVIIFLVTSIRASSSRWIIRGGAGVEFEHKYVDHSAREPEYRR